MSSMFLFLLAMQVYHVTRVESFFWSSAPPPPPPSPDYGGGSSDLVALIANYTTADSAPTHLQRFRVLQYNIKQMPNSLLARYFGGYMEGFDQKRRLKEFLKALRQFGSATAAAEIPDVVVLNEVFTKAARKAVEEELGDIFPYQTNIVGNDCPVLGFLRGDWDSVSGDCRGSHFIPIDNYYY